MQTARIDTPHPDIELGVERKPLDYLACAPDAGIGPGTGLALFVAGYGMDPCGAYAQNLLAHLANRYDCLAVSARYFGADFQKTGRVVPMPDFFVKLAEHYGVTVSMPREVNMVAMLHELAGLLAQNGITKLHGDCRLAIVADEYNAMGFLPALDHLQVVHRLLAEHKLDRRRLFVIGTSYGGYIASLMAKLAPDTFRLVIDNSGFSSAEDDLPGVMGVSRGWIGGVSMIVMSARSWSEEPAALNYFSPPRRQIRSLFEERHLFPNTARLYAYHVAGDTVAPTERKLRLRETYAGRVAYDLRIIEAADLDGRLFKTLEHGMEASMRGLFELSYEKYQEAGGALADHTDFDLECERVFACSGEDYVLRYSRRDGVRATLAQR